MEKLLHNSQIYSYYDYGSEAEFEAEIVQQSAQIFGDKTIYIDIKKRIGKGILTIPDGYLIDLSFVDDPRLYIIENELSTHDPYKHIGSQILKFAISYKESGRKIKAFLLDHIQDNCSALELINKSLEQLSYRNIDDLLEDLIYEKPVAAIVIIDKASEELENVLSQLTINTDIIEFQTYKNENDVIHKFIPFNSDIRETKSSTRPSINAHDLNTVVVPAREEGFEQEFIGNDRWYQIRINAAMIDKIKYIAAYQTAPISAITHVAEVGSIEKWKDTNKYVLNFKKPAEKIGPIKLSKDKDARGMAPQAPRYTSYELLRSAKTLSDVF